MFKLPSILHKLNRAENIFYTTSTYLPDKPDGRRWDFETEADPDYRKFREKTLTSNDDCVNLRI